MQGYLLLDANVTVTCQNCQAAISLLLRHHVSVYPMIQIAADVLFLAYLRHTVLKAVHPLRCDACHCECSFGTYDHTATNDVTSIGMLAATCCCQDVPPPTHLCLKACLLRLPLQQTALGLLHKRP